MGLIEQSVDLTQHTLCYRPHAFGRCHYYQAWPYTYVHVLRVHVRRSRSHKYRPITSSKPLFSFSCVQRALLHDFIKICLLKLLGGFFKVKSQKLKQTTNFPHSFQKVKSSEKLSLYGKLKARAFYSFFQAGQLKVSFKSYYLFSEAKSTAFTKNLQKQQLNKQILIKAPEARAQTNKPSASALACCCKRRESLGDRACSQLAHNARFGQRQGNLPTRRQPRRPHAMPCRAANNLWLLFT